MRRSALFLLAIAAFVAFALSLSVSGADASEGGAKIGNMFYETVPKALEASESGDVVFVIGDEVSGKNPYMSATIDEDVTVKEGVTLVLPYSSVLDKDGTMDGNDKASAKISNDRYLALILEKGSTITVEGELIVGGVLSKLFTFDYQGHTSGSFARLYIKGDVTVKDGGVLRCYGSLMGTGTLRAEKGSEIYEPFIVTDYVGGDFAYVNYNSGQSPFNRYAVQNIQSKFEMEYGAIVHGLMNLYANKKFNKATVTLVGVDEGLIKLAEGASLTTRYVSSEYLSAEGMSDVWDDDWQSNIWNDVGKKYIRIVGGGSAGSIILDVQGRHVDTAKTVFSIPYNFDITIVSGNFEIANQLRFLPGSSLGVARGATLNVTGTLICYNGLYDHVFEKKYYPTPEILSAGGFSVVADMVVSGEMKVSGTFLGTIQSSVVGSKVQIDNDAKLSSTAVYGADGKFNGKIIENKTSMPISAMACGADGNLFTLLPGKTYTSIDRVSRDVAFVCQYKDEISGYSGVLTFTQSIMGAWDTGDFHVTYNANGGSGKVPTDSGLYEYGEYATVLAKNTLSKSGFEFSGWSASKDGSVPIYKQGSLIRVLGDTVLYAVWEKEKVHVTGVTLNKTSAELLTGESLELIATVMPADATDKSVVWSSSSLKIASVSGGKVAGISPGTATITVRTSDGGYTATCKVTVTAKIVPVTGITLNKDALSIVQGESATVIATLSPSNATNKTVIWSTSDSSVATVSSGRISGISPGTAIITAVTSDGGFEAECKVTVDDGEVHVESVSIDKSAGTIKIGETLALRAIITPSDATNRTVFWSSSAPSVASVSGGVVTGLSEGVAIITVTAQDGGATDSCQISVQRVPVTAISISEEEASVAIGYECSLGVDIIPSDASDKRIEWSTSDPSVATVSNGVVKAVSPGTAIITATSVDGGFSDQCVVTVVKSAIHVAGVTLDRTSASIMVGEETALKVTVTPSDADNKVIIWKSVDPSVANVGQDGIVKGLSAGVTKIVASSADGNISDSCSITVIAKEIPAESVSLDKSTASMAEGENLKLTAEVLPLDSTDNVQWSSSDTSVAKVSSDGLVTALSAGKATITAIAGGFSDSCQITVKEPVRAVEGITLDRESMSLVSGSTQTIVATVIPYDATNKEVFWITSDPSVATVSDGVVTGVYEGTANIMVKTADGGFEAKCVVSVSSDIISVTGVALDRSSATIVLEETLTLSAKVSPSNATNKEVYWSTSDPSVATVSDGIVTAVSEGTATISVLTMDGGYSAECTVTVAKGEIHVTGVSLSSSALALKAGDSAKLSAEVRPADASDKRVTWKTSDSAVATVDSDGNVKAVSPGSATITVTTVDGSHSAECAVTVAEEPHPEGGGSNAMLYVGIAVIALLAIIAAVYFVRHR
ncbi:MAG: Ig-like domain-containing protein [Candidatus Methanomethylophilaceae archaeon]|nr:Ig-like domain-containing protein [Candidatus Methanomethylophilaceae archaeon]